MTSNFWHEGKLVLDSCVCLSKLVVCRAFRALVAWWPSVMIGGLCGFLQKGNVVYIILNRTCIAHFHNQVNCSLELLCNTMRTRFLSLALACWPNLCECLTANRCFNLRASTGHWDEDQGHVWLVTWATSWILLPSSFHFIVMMFILSPFKVT